jgi:hypothetical protein
VLAQSNASLRILLAWYHPVTSSLAFALNT